MLGFGSKKSRRKKMKEEEATTKSRDDHYYDVIPSRQIDRGDDHTGVTCPPPTPPPITRIPVSSRSLAANSIGTDPPTSEFLAGNFRPTHTATCVISNKRGIIPTTVGYLLGDLETDYPVSEVTTNIVSIILFVLEYLFL